MSDEADMSDKRIEDAVTDAVEWASKAVAAMPKGEAGECTYCGWHVKRLVGGACGHCRDRFGLR